MYYDTGDGENITLNKLLQHFDLDLNLPSELLEIKVNVKFKNANLEVQNEIYIFKMVDSSLTINLSSNNKPLIKSQDAKPSEGLPFGSFCCHGWDGSIISIS